MSALPIRVYEYGTIRLNQTDGFEPRHLKALVAFNEQEEHRNKYFTLTYNGVRFNEHVGVLQVDDLTIEVLPKADRDAGENQKAQWRDALLDMLKVCRLLQVEHLDMAQLSLKKNSILEIYCQLFLSECTRLVQEGLVKKYRFEEGNRTSLKGRLLFAKNIALNATHGERFYVRSQVYDRDNLFNALLATTLQVIPFISVDPNSRLKCQELLAAFPDLPAVTVTPELFDRLVYDRKTERYRNALFISRLLLLKFRPDLKGGKQPVLAIMFNMNTLWEEYVFRKLKQAESAFGVQISRQSHTNFWRNEETGRSKKIRPDIVIRFSGNSRPPLIIDTKWKIPANLSPSDQDLKQLYIYNEYWGCQESFLLYPAMESIRRDGAFYRPDSEGFIHHCHVLTTTIFNNTGEHPERLNKMVGHELLRSIIGRIDAGTPLQI